MFDSSRDRQYPEFFASSQIFGSFLALLPTGRYAQLCATMGDKFFLHALEQVKLELTLGSSKRRSRICFFLCRIEPRPNWRNNRCSHLSSKKVLVADPVSYTHLT